MKRIIKCRRCKSTKTIQTKEGKVCCINCGYVGLVKKKKGNFITRMFTK